MTTALIVVAGWLAIALSAISVLAFAGGALYIYRRIERDHASDFHPYGDA